MLMLTYSRDVQYMRPMIPCNDRVHWLQATSLTMRAMRYHFRTHRPADLTDLFN